MAESGPGLSTHGAACTAQEWLAFAMMLGQQFALPPGRALHAALGCPQTPHSFAQQTCLQYRSEKEFRASLCLS